MSKLSRTILLLASISFLLSCTGPPAMTMVNGVRIEVPSDRSTNPEIITIPLPRDSSLDRVKLDLVRAGFVLQSTQDRLGIIQTNEKVLGGDEVFCKIYSPEQHAQEAAWCMGGLVIAAIATAAIVTSRDDNKTKPVRKEDHHEDHCDGYHSTEQKTDFVQSKGRLQIIAVPDKDSTQTRLEITAFLSTYTNGAKGNENQSMRLHPFVQKYACLLAHQECGKAPGQKIVKDTY